MHFGQVQALAPHIPLPGETAQFSWMHLTHRVL